MKYILAFISLLIFSFPGPAQDDGEAGVDNMVTVITGGFEAITSERTGQPIQGPRTETVKAFLEQAGVPFKNETTLWSRAIRRTMKEPRTLLYPVTRTPERETMFDWIQEIDTHTFRLLGKKELAAKNLSKEEIISGDYLAICEETTVNCQILRDFGFPEDKILKVKGRVTEDIINLLVNGRASFFMDDLSYIKDNTRPSLTEKIETVGDYAVTYHEYLAGYKTDPTLMKRFADMK